MQAILMMGALTTTYDSEARLFGSVLRGAWRKWSAQRGFFLGRLYCTPVCLSLIRPNAQWRAAAHFPKRMAMDCLL